MLEINNTLLKKNNKTTQSLEENTAKKILGKSQGFYSTVDYFASDTSEERGALN